MIRRLPLTALAAMLALPALAQPNEIHVYNWSDYIAEDTVAKFEEATGIKVVYDVYDSNEVLEAKLLAGSSGYDVVVPTSSFLQRQIAAGVYQPLDKTKLPNLANMDPALMERAAFYDPDNAHATIWMWGTTGIGYNVEAVEERLGPEAPVDSWALVFDPQYAAKLADCGISLLDSSTDILPSALAYLGLDPTSQEGEDFEKAAALVEAVRPYVRYFHSSQYISDLANGEICVAVGFSGDVFIAADRAVQAGTGIEIAYSVPKEGAQQWFDMAAIPADAPNPDGAHAFLNFVMDPQISADITNHVWYANANAASLPLVDPEIAGDPSIFPPDEVRAKLFPTVVHDARTDRLLTRLWTAVKTGQ
jgi:putrescine transport system substrate-binding protein